MSVISYMKILFEKYLQAQTQSSWQGGSLLRTRLATVFPLCQWKTAGQTSCRHQTNVILHKCPYHRAMPQDSRSHTPAYCRWWPLNKFLISSFISFLGLSFVGLSLLVCTQNMCVDVAQIYPSLLSKCLDIDFPSADCWIWQTGSSDNNAFILLFSIERFLYRVSASTNLSIRIWHSLPKHLHYCHYGQWQSSWIRKESFSWQQFILSFILNI